MSSHYIKQWWSISKKYSYVTSANQFGCLHPDVLQWFPNGVFSWYELIQNCCNVFVILFSTLQRLWIVAFPYLMVSYLVLPLIVLGWGLLKLRSLISPLREILIYQEHRLDILNSVHICQVSPQLSSGDTCQIWTWYFTGNLCFDDSKKIRKITKRRKLA